MNSAGFHLISVLIILFCFSSGESVYGKNLEKQTLVASGICTELDCVSPVNGPKICCNECFFKNWTVQNLDLLEVQAVKGELPTCKLDGCGGCSFYLAAEGYQENGKFFVLNWTQIDYPVKPDPSDPFENLAPKPKPTATPKK